MTTIVGVKTNIGLEKIVIGSDSQESHFASDGEMVAKRAIPKIIHGESWALGYAGTSRDQNFYRFQQILQGNKRYGSSPEKAKEVITKAVQKFRDSKGKELKFNLDYEGSDFLEVCYFNSLMKKTNPNEKDPTNKFILGANFPDGKLGLWIVDEFGNLQEADKEKEFYYLCMGSGSAIVEKYIEDEIFENKIDPNNIDSDCAIDIVINSLKKAQKDANTGFPIELVVLDSLKINLYGRSIEDAISNAFEKRIKEIKEEQKT